MLNEDLTEILTRARERQARAKETRACEHCGAEFPPARDWQRFCSTKCRVANHEVKAQALIANLKEELMQMKGARPLTRGLTLSKGKLQLYVENTVRTLEENLEDIKRTNSFLRKRVVKESDEELESQFETELVKAGLQASSHVGHSGDEPHDNGAGR